MTNPIKVTAYQVCSVVIVLILSWTTTTTAEVIGLGACPVVKPDGSLPLEGTWYEQRSYDSAFHGVLRCIQFVFGKIENGVAPLDVNGLLFLTGRNYHLHGRIIPVPSTSLNVYSVDFPFTYLRPQNLFVLGIAANRWATIYSCTNYGVFHVLQVTVLTAERIPRAADIEEALTVINSNNFPKLFLRKVDQTIC